MLLDFSWLNFINCILYMTVLYCVIVRANLMHGDKLLTQKLPIYMIVIGVMYSGFAPFSSEYSINWQDLFLPTGLAMFFLRYIHRVEKFMTRAEQ